MLFLKKINQKVLSHKAVLPSLDFGPRSLTVVFCFLLLLFSTNWHTGTILISKLCLPVCIKLPGRLGSLPTWAGILGPDRLQHLPGITRDK